MKRNIICIIISVVLLVTASVPISATPLKNNTIVAEKNELRAAHYDENAYKLLDKLDITLEERNSKVTELLVQLNSFQNTQEKQEYIISELEKLGMFILESSIPQRNNNASPRSVGNNMTWRGVIITYDNIDDSWLLSAGGNWNQPVEWINDIEFPFLSYVGQKVNVGGVDGLGIRLYDTYGVYQNTELTESYMYVSDGNGTSDIIYSRVAGINPSNGVFFEFQDYAECISLGLTSDTWVYYGNNFSVFARYSQNFENYHGCAAIEYVHTWNSTSISSVTVGASDFNITFTNGSNYFRKTGGSDTAF